jgi:hypothetical protein
MPDDLTFGELRLASMLHKPTAAVAVAQLAELAKSFPTQTLERFMDGAAIDAHTRLIRQNKNNLELFAQTLADMVIQIDRFAALNDIDLAASIRKRFETAASQN